MDGRASRSSSATRCVTTVYFSFTHFDLLSPPQWVGLPNYRYLFDEGPVRLAGGRATRCGSMGDPRAAPRARSRSASRCCSPGPARRGIFRTIFYLPALAPPVAATLAFVYLLNPATGPVNTLLGTSASSGPLWFNSPDWSKPSLVLLGLWGVGDMMVIFLAALLDVPRQLYEAAALDGAERWQRFRYVTLPTICPVILFAAVTGVIDDAAVLHPGAGRGVVAAGRRRPPGAANAARLPGGVDALLPALALPAGFRYFDLGYAYAMAVVLFVVAFAVTTLLIVRSRRWVHYPRGGALMATSRASLAG